MVQKQLRPMFFKYRFISLNKAGQKKIQFWNDGAGRLKRGRGGVLITLYEIEYVTANNSLTLEDDIMK